MKTTDSGSVLIIFLFAAMAAGLFLAGVTTWANRVLHRRKLEISLQNILVTVLRIQAEALEKLAIQASSINSLIEKVQPDGALVSSSNWSSVRQHADDLKSSLSGHKGRMTAVRSVIATANNLDPTRLTLSTNLNPPIGVSLKGQWILDEQGQRAWVDSLWFQREWEPSIGDSRTLPIARATYDEAASRGKIVWEGRIDNIHNPIRNGGYPRSWEETQLNSVYEPYRQAYFSTRDTP